MEDLRKQYTSNGIDESMIDHPLDQLRQWFRVALDATSAPWFEPNAATLATASAAGAVTARIVLLKGIDERGLRFFTNYESPKGRQLAENPRASIVLYWPHLEQQVRAEGSVERLARELSEQYFHSRPRGSQISAAVSAQSEVIASRVELEQRAAALAQQLGDRPVPLPDNWGGYRLVPVKVEFWQGREDRLHDRICYRREDGQWQRTRLSP